MTADRWVAAVAVLIAAAILAAALITWWLQRERRTITNRAIDLYSHDRADEVQPPQEET